MIVETRRTDFTKPVNRDRAIVEEGDAVLVWGATGGLGSLAVGALLIASAATPPASCPLVWLKMKMNEGV